MRNFIVTGCGRSGTQYMASLLNELGCSCGPESFYNLRNLTLDDEITTFLSEEKIEYSSQSHIFDTLGESSWLAVPYLAHIPPGVVVLHQTRDPLAVVRSKIRTNFFQRKKKVRTLAFASQHCPLVDEGSPFEKSLKYWIYWNRMAEAAELRKDIHYLRYRIEDLDQILLRQILDLIQFPVEETRLVDALKSQPRDFNTRGDKDNDNQITWDMLAKGHLLAELENTAKKYGYKV